MCFVGFQEQTAIIYLYINYQLVCITQKKYVFAVRTGSVKINKVKHRPYRVNTWKGKTKAVTGIQISCLSPFPLVHLVVANSVHITAYSDLCLQTFCRYASQ